MRDIICIVQSVPVEAHFVIFTVSYEPMPNEVTFEYRANVADELCLRTGRTV